MKIIADGNGSFRGDGIPDAFAERIDIAVDRILPHSNNIPWRVSFIDLEIRLKKAELLDSPACVDNLKTSSRLSLTSLRCTEALSEIRTIENAIRQSVEKIVDVRLRKI